MTQRLNYAQQAPDLFKTLAALGAAATGADAVVIAAVAEATVAAGAASVAGATRDRST